MEPVSSGLVIDWRLLALQAFNFLLLFGILAWLMWKPLLKSLDERRTTIAEGLAAAEEQKRAAARAEEDRVKLLATAREEATKLVAETREELKAERVATKVALVKEREQILATMEKRLAQEQAKLETSVRSHLASLVVTAVGRVLAETPQKSDQLESQIEKTVKELS